MSGLYASQQLAGYVNYIRNIAIVGAGGQVGTYLTNALLKSGKHTITALTRPDSSNKLPEGVKTQHINYDDHASMVSALQGQDALVITMATTAPPETSQKLVRAACEAKVPFILPNEWGLDHDNESLAIESKIGHVNLATRKLIKELGGTTTSYIAFVNSFWYEYSLPFGPATFGFDIPNKKAIFFDEGKTKINTSSFPQCGKGLAGLMALKVLPEDENDKSTTLSQFKNKSVYVTSFTLSQEDMLESLLRVTGDKRENWTIEYEPVQERWQKASDGMKKAFNRPDFARAMYSRVFFPDGAGNYGEKKGLHNKVLGIEEEDVDEYTKIALQRGGPGVA